MTPRKRQDVQRTLDTLDAQIAPLLKRRGELAELITQLDDPLATELERAVHAYAEAEDALSAWERDQELCDGLTDGPPMRIPDSVFDEIRRAKVRVEKAREALRLAGREA